MPPKAVTKRLGCMHHVQHHTTVRLRTICQAALSDITTHKGSQWKVAPASTESYRKPSLARINQTGGTAGPLLVNLHAAIAPHCAYAACLHAHIMGPVQCTLPEFQGQPAAYLLRRNHLMGRKRLGCRTGAPVRYDTGSHSAQYASNTAASRSAARLSFCRAANVVLRTSRSALTCAGSAPLSDAQQALCIRLCYKRSSWTWLVRSRMRWPKRALHTFSQWL